jgi:5-formyltetrahydrofolate cyclo-ligase
MAPAVVGPGDGWMRATKADLRRQMRATLTTLSPATFAEGGGRVDHHLAPLLPPTGIVAAYASRADELATGPLIARVRARGLQLALPRIDGDTLAFVVVDDVDALPRDRWGIAAPAADAPAVALGACALVIVPGLAFDDDGHRLGHGRGFYDRALAAAGVVDRAVGVFLDEQRVPRVPTDAHDVRLRRVCTPARGVHVVVE